VRYKVDRPPIPAVAIAGGAAQLTAAGNDLGYENVFRRQVEALGARGDTLVAFSTSGRSPNVNAALLAAQGKGLATLGFSGFKGMTVHPDVDLNVPSIEVPRIQEAHLFIVHALCEELDRRGAHAGKAPSHSHPPEPL
jgi:D-sedoheptulose 7-phosphate isomerase